MTNIILTGTPGSGKTTLLRGLEVEGAAVIEEAATDIITLQQALGHASPWESPRFLEDVLALQCHRQNLSKEIPLNTVYFDRSPICTFALALYLGYTPPDPLRAEISRLKACNFYNKKVIFVENLGFIQPSAARQISYQEALKFEKIHLDTYRAFGFECVMLAPAPLPLRLQKVYHL